MAASLRKIILLSFLLPMFVFAQDAKSVLNNYYDAVGMDKISKLKTLESESEITQMGMSLTIKEYKKAPSKHKSVTSFQGMEIVSLYDGEKAWMLNPMTGATEAQEITGPQLDQVKLQAGMEGMIYKLEKNGSNFEYAGKETQGSKEYEVLKFSSGDGTNVKAYFNTETHLPEVYEIETTQEGATVMTKIAQSDFREVDGMKFPYKSEISVNGQVMANTEIKSIKINEDIPDSVFKI